MNSRDWRDKGIEAARPLGTQSHRTCISGFGFQSSQAGPSPCMCVLFPSFLPRRLGGTHGVSRPGSLLITLISCTLCGFRRGDNDMWGRDRPLPEACVLKYTWCLGIDWGWHPLLGVSAFGRLVEGVQDHEQVTLYTAPFVLLCMPRPAPIQVKSRCHDNKRYLGMEDSCERQLLPWEELGRGCQYPWSYHLV